MFFKQIFQTYSPKGENQGKINIFKQTGYYQIVKAR